MQQFTTVKQQKYSLPNFRSKQPSEEKRSSDKRSSIEPSCRQSNRGSTRPATLAAMGVVPTNNQPVLRQTKTHAQLPQKHHQTQSSQLNFDSLQNLTNIRKQPPIGRAPSVKLAQYQLSVKSSVTKANSGKVEKLGSFKDRMEAIKKMSSSNFFTDFNSQHLLVDYQSGVAITQEHQYGESKPHRLIRGQSHLAHKSSNLRLQKDGSNQSATAFNSGLSSANIRSSKYSLQMNSVSNKNLPARSGVPPNFLQKNRGSPDKNPITSKKQSTQAGAKRYQNSGLDYSSAGGAPETDNTHQILDNQYTKLLKNQQQKATKKGDQRVILSTESQDERIKLVVMQSSFVDVIQAMYTNEVSTTEVKNSETLADDYRYDSEANRQKSFTQESNKITADEHLIESTLKNETKYLNSTEALDSMDKDKIAIDKNPPLAEPTFQQNSQQENSQQENSQQEYKPEGDKEKHQKHDSILTEPHNRQIKMMDTITFVNGFQPVQWIFTDLLGRIQAKNICQINVNEVIKAFLINLNHNKQTDFSNDDLLQFMDKDQINQKICFAIKGQRRELLDINDLLQLREKFPNGLDALQLYKIPTRSFIPFYFHHVLSFDEMGRPLRSTLMRLPMAEVQAQQEKETLQRTMDRLKVETTSIQERVQQVSNDVVGRLTEVSPVVLLNIVIVYLLEEDTLDPWFVGTQKCEVLTQKIINKRKRKRQFVKVPHPFQQQIRDYESTQQDESVQEIPSMSPDSPTRIQIIDTGGMQSYYGHSSKQRNTRGGRTSSTTTVFQKLDQRSQITTTQKNIQNEMEDEEQQMMLLRDSDTYGRLLEQQAKDTSMSMQKLLLQDDQNDLNRLGTTAMGKLKKSFDDSIRRKAALGPVHKSQPTSKRAYVSETVSMNGIGNEVSQSSEKDGIQPLEEYQTTQVVGTHQRHQNENKALNSQYSPYENQVTNINLNQQDMGTSALVDQSQSLKNIQDLMQSQTFMQDLREEELLVQDYQDVKSVSKKMPARGHSANVYATRPKMNRHFSSFGNHGQNKRAPPQDVYLLQSKELLSADQLFQGLAKIGMEYGKTTTSAGRKTTSPHSFNRQASHPPTSKFGETHNRRPAGKRSGTASRIRAFLERQEQLKVCSDETKASKLLVKPQDVRILNMFPDYLHKTASRHHSKFLFGDSEQHRVFRDYKNAMKSMENQVKNLGHSMLPQDVIKDEVKMFQFTRDTAGGHKVFDMKMSDLDELTFLSNVAEMTVQDNNADAAKYGVYSGVEGLGQQNLDLASLAHGDSSSQKKIDSLDQNLDMFSNIEVKKRRREEAMLRREKDSQLPQRQDDLKDFLAEALQESRKLFNSNAQKNYLTTQSDKEAFQMIQAQRQLDGVAVCDAEKVIDDFKNNKLYHPMPGEDYMLSGQVPKVNHELAEKYVEMREAIRRRKALQQAQSRRDEAFLRKASETFISKKSSRTVQSKRKAVQSAKPGVTNKTFLKVSGHEIDTVSGLLTNINSSPHIRHTQMRDSLNDQAFYHTQGHVGQWNDKNMLRQSGTAESNNDVYSSQEMRVGKYVHQAGGTGTEIIVKSSIPQSNLQSIETIDKVQSAAILQSEVTLQPTNVGAPFPKCSLGLYCENPNIQLSKEMSMEDVCYIQQGELSRAKLYLQQTRSDDCIQRYSHQFNQVSNSQFSQQPRTDFEEGLMSSLKLSPDMQTLQAVGQLSDGVGQYGDDQDVSRRDVAVGDSVQGIALKSSTSNTFNQNTAQNARYGHNSIDDSEKEGTITGSGMDTGAKDALLEHIDQSNVMIGILGTLGTRNDSSKPTRYQAYSEQLIQETCLSTQPLIQKLSQRYSDSIDSKKQAENQSEITELLCQSGTRAVKKLANYVLQDYGLGIFSKEKNVELEESTAKMILKPLEDFGVKQIEDFEQKEDGVLKERNISVNLVHAADSRQDAIHQDNLVKRSASEGNQSTFMGSQLSQLGIRHVKLDQEKWVPSPELVPCCVRCFSIATYILNYQLQVATNNKVEEGKQTRDD